MPPLVFHEMTYEEWQKQLNTVDPDLGSASDRMRQIFNQSEALPLAGKWSVICLGVSVAILDHRKVLDFVFLVNK